MKRTLPLLLPLLVGLVSPVFASSPTVVFDASVRERSLALFESLWNGEPQALTAALDALSSDLELSVAQRDAAAWDLVRRMRGLAPGEVSMAVIERLKGWETQAWKTHEESTSWQIPMFNVSSAAQGLENQWQFQQGALNVTGEGVALAEWLQRYAEAPDQPHARGVRSALHRVPDWQLDKLIDVALDDAELSESLLPELWLARRDLTPLSQWLIVAPVDRVSEILSRAHQVLPDGLLLQLGSELIAHSDPAVRALAIARQTGTWLRIETWPDQWARELWTLRADPALRSSVDLQLIRLDAPRRWQMDPALAPQGALESDQFARLQFLARAVSNSSGAQR